MATLPKTRRLEGRISYHNIVGGFGKITTLSKPQKWFYYHVTSAGVDDFSSLKARVVVTFEPHPSDGGPLPLAKAIQVVA